MTDQYIEAVSINWDRIDRNSYLRDIEALRGLQSIQFHKPVTFFVGENGTGKSTMLEAIAVYYCHAFTDIVRASRRRYIKL